METSETEGKGKGLTFPVRPLGINFLQGVDGSDAVRGLHELLYVGSGSLAQSAILLSFIRPFLATPAGDRAPLTVPSI